MPDTDIRRLSIWATGALLPDLTVVLDIDPVIGLSRRGGPADRLEAEDVSFHRRVRRTFLDLASHDRSRYLVLDATADPGVIQERVVSRVLGLLPSSTGSRLRAIARGLAGARQ